MLLLTTKAKEGSTYIVTASFADEEGIAVVPSSITWTLTSAAGAVINARENISITPPAAEVDIVLSGADLAVTESLSSVTRVLTVQAVYASDAGPALSLKDSVSFKVENLIAVE